MREANSVRESHSMRDAGTTRDSIHIRKCLHGRGTHKAVDNTNTRTNLCTTGSPETQTGHRGERNLEERTMRDKDTLKDNPHTREYPYNRETHKADHANTGPYLYNPEEHTTRDKGTIMDNLHIREYPYTREAHMAEDRTNMELRRNSWSCKRMGDVIKDREPCSTRGRGSDQRRPLRWIDGACTPLDQRAADRSEAHMPH